MLRWELLSVAFHIFHFVESELEWRPWWRSARQELPIMVHLAPLFVHIDVGAPASEVIFASDAQGAGELQDGDCGGCGIVAAAAPADLVVDAWRSGFAPGKSIARLDGSLGDRWKPERTAEPTIPFSRLPQAIFDLPRVTLAKGRWRWETTSPRVSAELTATLRGHSLRWRMLIIIASSGSRTTVLLLPQ